MENLKLHTGDIFFTDTFSVASKIVKFLMTAPTVWHHIFWKFTGKIKKERPRFYHAGMILDEKQTIEQQDKVIIKSVDKIYKKNFVIWRKFDLTEYDKDLLVKIALEDLGEGYGILECIGKTISWITGIKYFARWFDMKDNDICVIRVADWYKRALGYTFGVKNINDLNTKIIDIYCKNHPEEWDCIAIRYT